MSKHAFIEVPILIPNGTTATAWLNVDHITSFIERPDGSAGVTTSDGSALVLNMTFSRLIDILSDFECHLFSPTSDCRYVETKKEDVSK